MATNWDAILSNTNNLQDVLSILKKVLASLDIKADITTIDEALTLINSLDADVQEKLSDVTAAITKFNNTGGFISAPTLEALQAITPEYDYQVARVDATGDEYRWNIDALPEPVWEPTGRNFLDDSKNYTDEKTYSLGIRQGSSFENLSVAIVDEDDKRTWLEAGLDGLPSDYAAESIRKKVGIDNLAQENISIAIVDEENSRTWLEADEVGEPTEYSKQIIKKKIGISDHNQENISIAIVDNEDKRTWLEADGAGKPTEYATQCIAEALQMSPDQSAQYYKSSYQDKVTKIVSGPNIVCWGDSMTAGAGAVHPYSYYLQQLLIQSSSNAQVRNCGVGGESSETICARQGGNPFLVKVNSGVINADASQKNPITLLSQGGTTVTPSPLLQGSGNPFESIGYFKGVFHGISGQIHPLNGGYVFVRDESGTNITANRPTHFYTNYSQELRDSIAIIWVGQNSNPSAGLDDLRAIQDAKAMIRHLKTLDKRYLVINKPISTPAEDRVWYAEFGDRYIPARAYLMEFGLADAGLTPTQQDLDSIAAGYVPNSLRFDNVHWNDYGYEILANLIFKKLKQLEWI